MHLNALPPPPLQAAAGEVIAALDRLPPLDVPALLAEAEAEDEVEEY